MFFIPLFQAAMSLKIVLSNCGADALLSHLCTNVLPGMGLPPELQQQVCKYPRLCFMCMIAQ